jgi:hypothetical protein
MNAGVRTVPWGVQSSPARAAHPGSRAWTVKGSNGVNLDLDLVLVLVLDDEVEVQDHVQVQVQAARSILRCSTQR